MHITYNTIAELSQDKIDVINTYLESLGRPIFTDQQLNFLKNITDVDVLELAENCACVRGYFADRDTLLRAKLLLINGNGLTLEQEYNQYKANLNKDDYEEADYLELLADERAVLSNEIFEYAIILNTSSSLSTDMIFLNKSLKPLEVEAVNLY